MKTVIDDIAAERSRQIDGEGFGAEHDDTHGNGALAIAAACYAAPERVHWVSPEEERRGVPANYANFLSWPWEREWWKPGTRRRNLVKAAALLVAEIERLDRIGP